MASIPTPKCFLLVLGLLLSMSHSALAAFFKVGDYNGKWGTDNYFQVGDLLSFVHHTKSADVHQVSREDYKACGAEIPIRTYSDDDNVAPLTEAATYYFISADRSQCKEGRKLMVVVLAGAPGVVPAAAPVVVKPPPPPPAPISPPVAVPAPSPTAPPTPPPAPTVAPSSPPSASSPTPTTAVPAPSTASPIGSPETAISPPGPPALGPATPPSGTSAASLTVLRSWIVAAAGFFCMFALL